MLHGAPASALRPYTSMRGMQGIAAEYRAGIHTHTQLSTKSAPSYRLHESALTLAAACAKVQLAASGTQNLLVMAHAFSCVSGRAARLCTRSVLELRDGPLTLIDPAQYSLQPHDLVTPLHHWKDL